MSAAVALTAIDAAITGISALLNMIGASQRVSAVIAARIAENRAEWTQEERQLIEDEMQASKAYAAGAIAKGQAAEGVQIIGGNVQP